MPSTATLLGIKGRTMSRLPAEISSWLRRHWALALAGLLVVFIAGGVSMSRFAPDRAPPPPVSAASP